MLLCVCTVVQLTCCVISRILKFYNGKVATATCVIVMLIFACNCLTLFWNHVAVLRVNNSFCGHVLLLLLGLVTHNSES